MGAISRMFAPQASLSQDDIRRALMESGVSGYAGYGTSGSGTTVTAHSAMCVSAVFACVQVISQTIGQLPLVLYRKTAKGKQEAVDHPLYNLIGSKPNKFNNSQSFREMLSAHTCLRGNGYAFINRVGNGRVYELLPLESSAVTINRDPVTWEISYTVAQNGGINGTFGADKVFHIMGMTLNGYEGVSPIKYARETIGLSMAAEQHGAKVFKNGAKPSGTLTTTNTLKDDAFKRLQDQLETGYTGENAHKTMILEGGTTFAPISMNNDDLQYMEIQGFQVPQLARFYRMPLHKIQEMSASTNNNIEHQGLEFLSDTMAPWFTRWKTSLNTQLLSPQEQKEYFWDFDTDDMIKPDMKSRFEAYSSGISSEILNPNECRGWENMDRYEGGDVYLNRNTKPAPPTGEGKQNEK